MTGPGIDDALATGTRLGRYEIVRRLAIGGMAEIYLARMTGHAGFAKHVVVKRILPSFARDAEFVRMFLNEARYAATLDHPNISHVYDFGEEGGLYYYAMEYLHGDDCRTLLRELGSKRTRLPLAHALTIVAGAATGCHFAHELVGDDGLPLGLVHRDVSPSNVVVTFAGAIKLVDFGIAKATQREEATAAGVTKGKLGYMAPEQCRAEPLDRRVDVYALGVLLYELTTQRRAFAADNDAAIVWAVMSGQVTWPREILPEYPPELEAIVRKAMHFDRAQRYATARELAAAIEEFARDHAITLGATQLGEFVTATMGARPEPWRTESGSDARAAMATPTPSPLALDGTPPAPLGFAPSDAKTYTPPGVVRPTPSAAPAGPATRPPEAPAPSRAPWLVAAAVGLIGGGAALWLALRPRPSASPSIAVVTERGTTLVESGATLDAGAPAIDAASSAPIDAAVALDAGRVARPPRPTDDPLSAAFNRRLAAVEACARAHPELAQSTSQISLRFELGLDGKPGKVELAPASLAPTPLGACILDVARGTRFGPQSAPVAFRIPVTIRPQ